MQIFLKKITSNLLDLIFPPQCILCKREGTVLCSTCLLALYSPSVARCQHCHTVLMATGICRQCQQHLLLLSGLRAFGSYQDPLRTCIHALKYEGHRKLAEPLGQLLAETYINYRLPADILLPVPLHPERLRERGYNQSALLARTCASKLGIACREDLLIRQRATIPQVGLSFHERLHNVSGAFQAACTFTTGALAERRILIIDDVCTTGATIEACAGPLFAAGARSVWGLVLARPDKG
jgi:ComF family protein